MFEINSKALIALVSDHVKKEFKEQNYILSYEEFLDIFSKNPKRMIRNSAQYMLDMFRYFGVEERTGYDGKSKFAMFQKVRANHKPPIIGQEDAHEAIYKVLEQFVRQGRIDKLILLHGPNGSSKSSTAEAISAALELYSQTDEGAVYKFNWVFPSDKIGYEGLGDDHQSKHIGFGSDQNGKNRTKSFAHLEDEEMICKIVSETRENPICILPKKHRIDFYKKIFLDLKISEECSRHFENMELSPKNKKIFESLLIAYKGDYGKLLRHIQVERFVYSSRYRVGIASVEPQMSLDAQDKQITIERNIQNIPPVLQNIRLFEAQGELIDANRGFIEFSDLLKRPLEAFKYLLTTIEKMNIALSSGIVDLDLIMIASANEKHLDAFKNTPDWPSFKGRFELIRVPYLLSVHLEEQIYKEDVIIIEKTKKIAPHALHLLAKWAVLTRLRQPDPDFYPDNLKGLIVKLNPYDKLALYDGDSLSDIFTESEKSLLKKNVDEILKECQSSVAYEGRFGASPREMKMLLYFASQNQMYDSLSTISIFNEIEQLTRDRTIYDYLQFEPRGEYHDFKAFLKHIKKEYAVNFLHEFLDSLNLYDQEQYLKSFKIYMKHLTAYLKHEKIYNEITGKNEDPNETLMGELEEMMGSKENKKLYREQLLGKMASWKVEYPKETLDVEKVFALELGAISKRIYGDKAEKIRKIKNGMMMFGSEDYEKLPWEILEQCESTFENLEKKYGYSKKTSWESLIFIEKEKY